MQGNKSVIVIRMVVALLILYAIFGLIRKTLSAPVLGKGGRYRHHRTGPAEAFLGSSNATPHPNAKRGDGVMSTGIDGVMSTGISKSPDSRYWRQLYKAALVEIDKSKLAQRIAEAEKAVVLRRGNCFRPPAITAKRQRLWRT